MLPRIGRFESSGPRGAKTTVSRTGAGTACRADLARTSGTGRQVAGGSDELNLAEASQGSVRAGPARSARKASAGRVKGVSVHRSHGRRGGAEVKRGVGFGRVWRPTNQQPRGLPGKVSMGSGSPRRRSLARPLPASASGGASDEDAVGVSVASATLAFFWGARCWSIRRRACFSGFVSELESIAVFGVVVADELHDSVVQVPVIRSGLLAGRDVDAGGLRRHGTTPAREQGQSRGPHRRSNAAGRLAKGADVELPVGCRTPRSFSA